MQFVNSGISRSRTSSCSGSHRGRQGEAARPVFVTGSRWARRVGQLAASYRADGLVKSGTLRLRRDASPRTRSSFRRSTRRVASASRSTTTRRSSRWTRGDQDLAFVKAAYPMLCRMLRRTCARRRPDVQRAPRRRRAAEDVGRRSARAHGGDRARSIRTRAAGPALARGPRRRDRRCRADPPVRAGRARLRPRGRRVVATPRRSRASSSASCLSSAAPSSTSTTRSSCCSRFRLLGTGFFRDVNLSLRRGTSAVTSSLVVNVVERNTIVVNDLWLGLSADAEPDGKARPLTAFGGIDVSEQNLAGTGVARRRDGPSPTASSRLHTRINDPSFLRSSWLAEARVLYNNAKTSSATVTSSSTIRATRTSRRRTTRSPRIDASGGLVGVRARALERGDARVLRLSPREDRRPSPRRRQPQARLRHRAHRLRPRAAPRSFSTIGATVVHDTRDEPFPAHARLASSATSNLADAPRSDYPYTKLVLRGSRLDWIALGITSYGSKEPWLGVRRRSALREVLCRRLHRPPAPPRARSRLRSPRGPEFISAPPSRRSATATTRRASPPSINSLSRPKTVYGVDVFGGVNLRGRQPARSVSHARVTTAPDGPVRLHLQPRPQARHRRWRPLPRHRQLPSASFPSARGRNEG